MKVYENGSLKSTATFRAFAGKRGLGGVSLGVAVPEKYFTFLVPGGNHDGIKVAIGFLAPSTVPSYKPNLITTPERGKNAGTVSVWNMADICQCSTHEGHAMSGMAAMHDTTVQGPPMPVATFRPFGARFGARHRCFQTLVEPWAGLHAGGCAAASLRHRPAPAFAFAFRAFATVLLLLDCYCAD